MLMVGGLGWISLKGYLQVLVSHGLVEVLDIWDGQQERERGPWELGPCPANKNVIG
jgi:hypothetical protein